VLTLDGVEPALARLYELRIALDALDPERDREEAARLQREIADLALTFGV
jgi:hypothetical protein